MDAMKSSNENQEIMKLKLYPDNVLRILCTPVQDDEFTDEFRAHLKMMQIHTHIFQGYALAAPQIGVNKRYFTVADSKDLTNVPKFIINPKITNEQGTRRYKESCLSLPGISAWNKRIEKFTLEYQDEYGVKKTFDCGGLFAIVVQHEIDHLDGVLFIDRLDSIEKNKVIGQVNKMRKK
jgi:peptide deformylase